MDKKKACFSEVLTTVCECTFYHLLDGSDVIRIWRLLPTRSAFSFPRNVSTTFDDGVPEIEIIIQKFWRFVFFIASVFEFLKQEFLHYL